MEHSPSQASTPLLHLATHSALFGAPSLFQAKLTQTVPTRTCRPSYPFLLLMIPLSGAIHWLTADLQICPQCQYKPLACPSGPAWEQNAITWGTAATLLVWPLQNAQFSSGALPDSPIQAWHPGWTHLFTVRSRVDRASLWKVMMTLVAGKSVS